MVYGRREVSIKPIGFPQAQSGRLPVVIDSTKPPLAFFVESLHAQTCFLKNKNKNIKAQLFTVALEKFEYLNQCYVV